MSYVANQYNHATPLSSVVSLVGETPNIPDGKEFTLFNNTLDGSYRPISGDVGLWGTHVSDADGSLPVRFELTVTETLTMNAFRLVGSDYGYPTAFIVRLYQGSTLMHTITETNNTQAEYVHYLPRTIQVTKYEVLITKVSEAGVPVRLYNLYNPGYLKRQDNAMVSYSRSSDTSSLLDLLRTDALSIKCDTLLDLTNATDATDRMPITLQYTPDVRIHAESNDRYPLCVSEESEQLNTVEDAGDTLKIRKVAESHILKTLGVGTDTLNVYVDEDTSHVLNYVDAIKDTCPVSVVASTITDLVNVHSVMKRPTRHIYGKVHITYTDPMLKAENNVTSSGSAYNSDTLQVLDGVQDTTEHLFTLYDNDLSGMYVVSNENSQVGWVSDVISNENGEFVDPPYLRIDFSERPLRSLQIVFDSTHGSVAKDFTVEYIHSDDTVTRHEILDNDASTVVFEDNAAGVIAVVITVTKVTKAFYPVAILDVPTLSTYVYVGYKDKSNLISIDLLEELTYDDSVEALGGVSANEISVSLDNSNGDFFFNNKLSPVASYLRRNRKIEPWLGVEISPGDIEWYPLGTFWSYKWDVPVEGLVAKVVGFDTIGLLDNTNFENHTVQLNKSIGSLIDYVLNDAKLQLDFLNWKIDPALYDVVIPYAWFDVASHTAALRKISLCYPMHIYCDREGAICAALQKLHMDYYYDTWSDSTNVISKDYSSLHTTLPNVINVEVKNPVVKADEVLVEDTLIFNVANVPSRILNFNAPYISDINVAVTCDDTVLYTYEVFSWGIKFAFTGTGNVSGIRCTGASLDISNTSTLVGRDENSIRINGAVKRDVQSDFIQRSDLASELIDRIMSLSETDKFDVDVEYRGDISLTINDPILLLDGIAPDNRYNIRRHELFWNGSLRGSAHLNT